MVPIMEGTHTVLRLYVPIRELSNISMYLPKGRALGFTYRIRAPFWERPDNNHVRGEEDLTGPKQRSQSSGSTGKLLNSRQATKEAVAELCWLAAEHRQLLADLLSLCGDCANRVKMGNQDGKLQDHMEGQEVYPGGQVISNSNYQHSLTTMSPEHKKATSKGRKLKKLGAKKLDTAEEFLHSKMKKKVGSKSSSSEPSVQTSPSVPVSPAVVERIPGSPVSVRASDTPVTGSFVSVSSNPILPIQEHFHIAREGWDFMEDNQTFDPDLDFCNDLSEYDSELCLGYEASSCSLMEGLTRRESGSNLRPINMFDSPGEGFPQGRSVLKSAHQLYEEISQRDTGVRVVVKVQDVEGTVQRVSHMSPDSAGSAVPQPGTSSCQQGYGEWRGPSRCLSQGDSRDKAGTKFVEGLQLPLSLTTETSTPAKSHNKSPSSPSLAGVFNTSFPASNSLQSMSPVLSPLSSKQASPPLNHRILLLSDEDVGQVRDGSSSREEPKVTTEVIDKNGNKRTITRLDLNLSRQPGNSKWTSPGLFTATGELGLLQITTPPPRPDTNADINAFIFLAM